MNTQPKQTQKDLGTASVDSTRAITQQDKRSPKRTMSVPYRFYFDSGVPVYDWPTGRKIIQTKWRRGSRTVKGYCLGHAVKKLVEPFMRKYGAQAKLNVTQAFRCDDTVNWTELSLQSIAISGFVLGTQERSLAVSADLPRPHL